MIPVYDAAAFARTLQLLAGGRRLHIISRGTKWALTREDTDRALRVLATKADALREAKPHRAAGYDIVVHHRDGTVEKWLEAKSSAAANPKEAAAKPKASSRTTPAVRKAVPKAKAGAPPTAATARKEAKPTR